MPKQTKNILIGYVLLIAALLFAIALYAKGYKAKPKYEYHLILEMNDVYLYDEKDRLIDSCKYGTDGVDSLLLKDNY